MHDDSTLLLETIKIEEGKIHNLSYHQARCNESRMALFDSQESLDLASVIHPPPKGLWRCRILYHTTLYSIEYIPYVPKDIETLQIIDAEISYDFKYAQRLHLECLPAQYHVDDVLFSKNGCVQDTSIANIAFFDGTTWYTPTHPLLKGTMRAKLLDTGYLETKEIKVTEIQNYKNVALMNAMIGFKIIKKIKFLYNERQI